jgi:hypothetical protein
MLNQPPMLYYFDPLSVTSQNTDSSPSLAFQNWSFIQDPGSISANTFFLPSQ